MRHCAVTLTGLLLAGCAHGDGPASGPQIAYQADVPAAYLGTFTPRPEVGAPISPERGTWWQSAGDPLLGELVTKALVANNDLAAAAARIGQASALARAARGARLPTLGAALDVDRSQNLRGSSGTSSDTVLNPRIDLGWNPDLFGQLRAGQRAARADLAAAGLDLANVRRILVNDLVRTYVAHRVIEERLRNTELSRQAQQDIMDTLERRYRLGLATETDRQQARLQLLQVRAVLPQLADERNRLRNRIAILIGETPQQAVHLLDQAGYIPNFSRPAAIGIPADLLRLRPDVAAAEERLLAAGERIGAARSALLPQLTLGGTLSSAAANPAGLFDAIIGQVFGRLAQSLFAGGAARAEVARNEAAAEEALALYRNSVLGALESVENALSALRSAEARLALDREGVEAAARAARQARRQYDLGLIDFFVLLSAEQSLLTQRDQLVATQADHAFALADLYAALGD